MRIECPICRRVIEGVSDDFGPRPFCSVRCRQVDLGNWLGERYVISSPTDDALTDEGGAGLPN